MSGRSRVVVVGSGAAGLAAAVAAREGGAEVTLLERGAATGGTTALSGGVAWLPGNHRAAEVGVEDSPAEAREYLAQPRPGRRRRGARRRVLRGRGPGGRASWRTPEGCAGTPLPYPDYHAERPGGKLGGRPLEPGPVAPDAGIAPLVREAPNVLGPVTYAELAARAASTAPRSRSAARAGS